MPTAPVILDLCGGTGSWSAPYREAGYDVRVIDPIADGNDIRLFVQPKESVRGVLAAPPCTHLSGSGALHWEAKGEAALLEAMSTVDAVIRIVFACKPRGLRWWVLENPRGRLTRFLGKPVATFDPCDYGDPYTKFTCLWGEFAMPPKDRVPITHRKGSSPIHRAAPGPERAKFRSITPPGFARAFFDHNR